METYDIQDVLDAHYTLGPLKCRYCGGLEVTFHQYQIEDGHCADCGKWQLTGE